MKKLLAALLSILVIAALCCVTASAKESDYEYYAFFDNEDGTLTEGVEFYINDRLVEQDEITSRIGKGYSDNCIGREGKDGANLPAGLIIWTNAGHYMFQSGVRMTDVSVMKITFTGCAFRLISDYCEGGWLAPTVTIDGEEVDCSLDGVDVASETYIVDVEGLDFGEHVVVITGNSDVEIDAFGIIGEEVPEEDTTEAADDTTAPAADDTTAPAADDTTAPAADDTTAPADNTTAPAADSTAEATDDNGGSNLGLIIGIIAAVVVIAVVVLVIVKKKK